MSAVTEFFHMGGYALYVWGSFGVTALVLLVEYVMLGVRRRSVLRRISRLKRAESREGQ
jgi:heme exporter protein D